MSFTRYFNFEIVAFHTFKIAVNEAAETYGFTPSAAALHVINVIKDYNKRGQLKHELSELNFQKYAINEFCSSRSQVINAHEFKKSWTS
ncbi:MAG: hypothetical protein ACJ708_09990 [Nitrososphaeraceae archaeon]